MGFITTDWKVANGVGKMPHSTSQFYKGYSPCSVYSCACKSSVDARDNVICQVNYEPWLNLSPIMFAYSSFES